MKIVLDKPLFKLVLKIVCSTLCLLSIKIEAQNSENVNVDSLLNILPHLKDDTNKLNTLDILVYVLPNGKWEKYNAELEELSERLMSHPDKEVRIAAKKRLATAINNWGYSKDINGEQEEAIQLYLKSLQLRKEINDQEGIAQSLNNLGDLYQTMGNINLAIGYFEQSLKIRESIGDQEGIAESYNNLGFLYDNLGNYIKALNFHQKSYALRAKINDALGMCGSLINIGNIYSNNLNDYLKAIDYWRKSLKYSNSDNGKSNKAHALNNIGVAYRKMAEMQRKKFGTTIDVKAKIDSSLFYCQKSYLVRKEINDKKGLGYSLNNLGHISLLINNLDDAEKYFNESLQIRRQVNDKKDLAFALIDVGLINLQKNKINIAEKYLLDAHKIASEIGFPEIIQKSSHLLYQISVKKGSYEKALNYFVLHILMRDSIQNQDIKKEMLKQQFQFEYKSKASADSIKVAEERKVMGLVLEKERSQKYALYGGLAIVVIFGFFIYNRYRITQKQKVIIERKEIETQKQKELIELKNTEVLASIEYAKRIQSAILPSSRIINEHLKSTFVLFLPKDIVAGDFYWIEKIQSKVYIAVCDCTGHGVPGAMVSVVCNNALNRAVAEFGERETGKIFNKTRELVLENFTKSDDDVKDGMDASLCALDLEKNVMQWSGANNPLWIYRANSNIIEEIKGDNQPIGKTDAAAPFKSHEISLFKGDIIYLFSDGYADQFGGDKLKKLTKAKFRDFLLSIANEPMEVQHNKLHDFHTKYRGAEEQVDDICIIGVKI
jgi:serine phosphatase RsbU (regulator of sigma subunit)